MTNLRNVLLSRDPLHRSILRFLDRHLNVLSYHERLELGFGDRPNYGWPMLRQAETARHLGINCFTALEFGVAGGNGLLAMEQHAELVERHTGIKVDVIGFDTGIGLPPLSDYRDHPYLWEPGEFQMDVEALQARLERARLIIGRIKNSLAPFLAEPIAPIGFIAFDLDLYSATKAALAVFDAPPSALMPRIICYFDDVLALPEVGYTHFAGELLAIREFNEENAMRTIDRGIGILRREYAHWQEQIYIAHLFDHPNYDLRTNPSANLNLRKPSGFPRE